MKVSWVFGRLIAFVHRAFRRRAWAFRRRTSDDPIAGELVELTPRDKEVPADEIPH